MKKIMVELTPTIWGLLAVILAIAAVIHNFPMGVPTFLAEFSAFILIALALYYQTVLAASFATFGSLMWLGNQYIHWYMGGLLMSENAPFFWMTAIINFLLLLCALFTIYTRSRSKASAVTVVLPSFIMLIYALWKMYLDFVVYAHVGLAALSGGLWATGIAMISAGSMLRLMEGTEKIALIIALLGLIISSYAAVALGLWLSIFR